MSGKSTDTEKIMIDPELVRRAMQWDQAAFTALYEATYYRVRYVALKYMKNETAADDVTQEAYIRIWNYLPSLGNPESFVPWCSRIVANTALNELRKTQPMLFSDMGAEGEDGSELGYDVEDTYLPNQPELQFTQQEESEIIRSMIDSLSDEQRICILMYYIEGLSVNEIAETLGCSAGTVKSRLNYGRQNIKAKAEELQKKGYNFSGISGLAVLLFLLGVEARRMWAAPVMVSSASFIAAGAGAAPVVGNAVSGSNVSAAGVTPNAAEMAMSPNAMHTAANPNMAHTMSTQAYAGGSGAGNVPQAQADPAVRASSGGNAGGDAPVIGNVTNKAGKKAADAKAAGAKTAGAKATGTKVAFLSTAAGKAVVGLAIATVLAVAGIAVALKVKDNKEEETTTEYSVAVIEPEATEVSVTEDATETVTEAVTEAATEAETEATTEASTEEAKAPDYIAEYARVLNEHQEAISGFQTYYGTFLDNYADGTYSPLTYPVAIVDAFGDDTPELFFWARDKEQWDEAGLFIYTMENGKAVQKYVGLHMPVAGARIVHNIYLSGKKDGVYAEFDVRDDTVEKDGLKGILWDGSNLNQTDGIDPSSVTLGEEIFGWNMTSPHAYTIDNAQEYLATLTAGNGEFGNEEVHALGDAFLKDLAAAATNPATDYESFWGEWDKVADKWGIYLNPNQQYSSDVYQYAYVDLNGDGIDELVLRCVALIVFRNGKLTATYATGNPGSFFYSIREDKHIVLNEVWSGSRTLYEYEMNADMSDLIEIRRERVDSSNPDDTEIKAMEESLAPELQLDYHKVSELP